MQYPSQSKWGKHGFLLLHYRAPRWPHSEVNKVVYLDFPSPSPIKSNAIHNGKLHGLSAGKMYDHFASKGHSTRDMLIYGIKDCSWWCFDYRGTRETMDKQAWLYQESSQQLQNLKYATSNQKNFSQHIFLCSNISRSSIFCKHATLPWIFFKKIFLVYI